MKESVEGYMASLKYSDMEKFADRNLCKTKEEFINRASRCMKEIPDDFIAHVRITIEVIE